jgi:hypothetical protein
MWMMLKQNNSTSHSDVNDITAMTLWHVNDVKSMTLYNSDMTHVIAMVLWHSDVEGLISNGNMTQWCWMIPKQWHYDTVMWRSQFKAMALCHCDVEGYTYKQLHYYNVMLKDIKAMALWLSDVEGYISNGTMTQGCWRISKQWHYDTVMLKDIQTMALWQSDVEGYISNGTMTQWCWRISKQWHYDTVMLKDM